MGVHFTTMFGVDVAAFRYPVYFREGFCFFFVLILDSIT